MVDIDKTREELSPKKRELLELLLKEQKDILSAARRRAIEPQPKRETFRPSFAQQRLWLLHQLDPRNSAYNISFSRRLAGALDIAALDRSLRTIIDRHHILRATFHLEDGRLVGRIGGAEPFKIAFNDLTGLPESERTAETRRMAREESTAPFDLSTGPLIRASVLRLSDEDHVVLVAMHHIVSDGWSIGVFLRELASLYNAYLNNMPLSLPELPIQYPDYAEWQHESLKGEAIESQLSYWKATLKGAPSRLELPDDSVRLAGTEPGGATERFEIPQTTYEGFKRLSQELGCTLFMTLAAAFNVLLYRYTYQEDIVLGTPIANRNPSETEALIGLFTNTLALRTDLSGDPSFEELLGRVREAAIGAYAHQDVPFEKLVQELQPQREVTRTPIFQVMFTLQNVPMPSLNLAGLSVTPLEAGTGGSMFDLTLTLMERSDQTSDGRSRLIAYAEYDARRFDCHRISGMMEHFATLLESVLADPQQPISKLQILTDREAREVTLEWNNTASEHATDDCYHQLFGARVAETPDATALIFEDERISYRALNEQANSLAQHLISLGVEPESLVGICVARSHLLAVSMLAVMKAGGAFVPLDPSLPPERLKYMVNDGRIRLILTHENLGGLFEGCAVEFVTLNAELLSNGITENAVASAAPENLAYAIYTSGSTGRPKAAMVTHRALVNHNFAVNRRYQLHRADSVLQFAAPGFDVAVEEVLPTWLAGAAVVVQKENAMASIMEFMEMIDRSGITVLNLPGSFWKKWVDLLSGAGMKLPAGVRLLILGSERISADQVARWRSLFGDSVGILNAYGLTETTVTSAVHGPVGEELSHSGDLPIGRPVANTRIYLLDKHMQVVPVGIPGELYIAGDGLSRGYLNKSELTAERFLPDPFSARGGERLFRTGDLGRYLPDGDLEFVGRVDDQIKIRGFRVEPDEIAASLAENKSVADSFVMFRDDASGQGVLAAYVAKRSGQNPTVSELRAYMRGKLPEYMMPAAIVILEALPRLPNGKIDRQALPAPEKRSAEIEAGYVAPRTETERSISSIWREVLGLEKVGVNDNFFDLGGHSLLMAEIFSRLQKVIDKEISMVELFEFPTVGSLARYLARDKGHKPSAVKAAQSNEKLKTGQSRLQQQFRARRLSKGR